MCQTDTINLFATEMLSKNHRHPLVSNLPAVNKALQGHSSPGQVSSIFSIMKSINRFVESASAYLVV